MALRLLHIAGFSFPLFPEIPMWPNIETAFWQTFPELTEAEMMERIGPECRPWHFEAQGAYCDEMARKYDDGKPTLFVGHSAGGIFARSIAEKFTQTEVREIVTICTPHRLGRNVFTRKLELSRDTDIPLVSIGAFFDIIVPAWTAKHPSASQHKTFYRAMHRGRFAKDPKSMLLIAQMAREVYLRTYPSETD